ncbi:MAG: ECF-type sigma factor [Tepidisphaeraceae bacterium]
MPAPDPPPGVERIELASFSRSAQPDEHSLRHLFEKVYGQLRAIAQNQMKQERSSHTLAATELVHQAYLRLSDGKTIDYQDQGHFLRVAAEAMRRILIEHARKRARHKRGGDRQRVTLSVVDAALPDDSDQLLALDEELRRLEEKDPRAGEVVRMRFFAGLTIEQTAAAMGLSERTVKREWEFARAWLAQRLQ